MAFKMRSNPMARNYGAPFNKKIGEDHTGEDHTNASHEAAAKDADYEARKKAELARLRSKESATHYGPSYKNPDGSSTTEFNPDESTWGWVNEPDSIISTQIHPHHPDTEETIVNPYGNLATSDKPSPSILTRLLRKM